MTTPAPTAVGSWTIRDALAVPGSWAGQHDTAVVLTGGSVLVAGGADATGAALARAARFDPGTGHWDTTGALHTTRRLHSLTRLADGRVLAAGGTSAAGQFPPPSLAAAEVFDPATGNWTVTGPLRVPRAGHSAALLADGSVLVAGGSTVRSGQSLGALRSAERFDPATGRWTEVAAMNDARTGHPAVVLGNGSVLVVGGSVPVSRTDEAALAFCELYDPDADAWTPTGSMLVPRTRHQVVSLSDTSVLVTGGAAPGSGADGTFDPFARATAEVYAQATGVWTAVEPMPAGRARHRAVPLGAGRALVIGGADSVRNDAGFASVLSYDAATNQWSPVDGLHTGRWSFAAAALGDGRVMVTGGVARTGLATGGSTTEVTGVTEIFAPDAP